MTHGEIPKQWKAHCFLEARCWKAFVSMEWKPTVSKHRKDPRLDTLPYCLLRILSILLILRINNYDSVAKTSATVIQVLSNRGNSCSNETHISYCYSFRCFSTTT